MEEQSPFTAQAAGSLNVVHEGCLTPQSQSLCYVASMMETLKSGKWVHNDNMKDAGDCSGIAVAQGYKSL